MLYDGVRTSQRRLMPAVAPRPVRRHRVDGDPVHLCALYINFGSPLEDLLLMQHLYVPVQHALKPPRPFRKFGRAGGKCSNNQINTSNLTSTMATKCMSSSVSAQPTTHQHQRVVSFASGKGRFRCSPLRRAVHEIAGLRTRSQSVRSPDRRKLCVYASAEGSQVGTANFSLQSPAAT